MVESNSEDSESISKKQVVFINGFSGVGKSRLVKALRQNMTFTKMETQNPILMGQGKYDFNDWDEPFSGVVTAFEDLIRNSEISTNNQTADEESPSTTAKIGSMLMEELGPTADILVRLMPSLKETLSLKHSTASTNDEISPEGEFIYEAAQTTCPSVCALSRFVIPDTRSESCLDEKF